MIIKRVFAKVGAWRLRHLPQPRVWIRTASSHKLTIYKRQKMATGTSKSITSPTSMMGLKTSLMSTAHSWRVANFTARQRMTNIWLKLVSGHSV
ncbi:Uncharacterised protein [Vibrio cholerae]|nr:Uncharacterised protein [Vibrio cholerae]